ncbi:hypothetical protein [Microbacterium sp. RURRCA19A]|uniref:hypothetical protein n=1 Tax=Microbacterium sp. RURRCA19A TaxID=1907391 RepID=UPI0009556777|nr:hypothetical protein [Microbacterium sp. RURRCA19A]SIS20072.1 hypothetical protein SAMN05880568_3501 [Microbacterium sp. RURRCA19A]
MTTLPERLASMGASTISNAMRAGDDRRRKIVQDFLPHVLVEEFIGQPLVKQLADLLDAHRIAVDLELQAAEAQFRREWSTLTGTEDLGKANTGGLRQSPGTGRIDYSRIRRR